MGCCGSKAPVADAADGAGGGAMATAAAGAGSSGARKTQASQGGAAGVRVYLKVSMGGGPPRTVVIALCSDVVPKTAENFRCLCTGEKGDGLTFKGSVFHHIQPGAIAQAGDITNSDGTGGTSIYGDYFDDENFDIKHDGPGVVSMANTGQHRNNSQFFICYEAAPQLDGNHVAFGHVVSGMDVLKDMEEFGTDNGHTTDEVVIVGCGEGADVDDAAPTAVSQ